MVAATKTVAMTTLQKILVTVTVAVLAGTGIYEARQAALLREQNQTLQQLQTPLAEQVQQLQIQLAGMTNRLDAMAELSSKNLKDNSELLKLRGENSQLHQQILKIRKRWSVPNPPVGNDLMDQATEVLTHSHRDLGLEGRLYRLKKRLRLTPEQTTALDNLFADEKQYRTTDPDFDAKVNAILTPEQQADLEQYWNNSRTNQIPSKAVSYAATELDQITPNLDLSLAQQAAMLPILTEYRKGYFRDCEIPNSSLEEQDVYFRSHELDNWFSRLATLTEQKLGAAKAVLDPEQFAIYKKFAQADEEMEILSTRGRQLAARQPGIPTTNP